MTDKEKYQEIYKLAKDTNKKIKKLYKDVNRDNPVDMDIEKTLKAMFYELAIEVIKK